MEYSEVFDKLWHIFLDWLLGEDTPEVRELLLNTKSKSALKITRSKLRRVLGIDIPTIYVEALINHVVDKVRNKLGINLHVEKISRKTENVYIVKKLDTE